MATTLTGGAARSPSVHSAVDAELLEADDEVFDRALPHALDAPSRTKVRRRPRRRRRRVRGRMAVPAFPRKSSAPLRRGSCPAQPTISRMLFARSSVISRPSCFERADHVSDVVGVEEVEDLGLAPPRARRGGRLRLDMDLEPGRVDGALDLLDGLEGELLERARRRLDGHGSRRGTARGALAVLESSGGGWREWPSCEATALMLIGGVG